jgi:hypothetical protein
VNTKKRDSAYRLLGNYQKPGFLLFLWQFWVNLKKTWFLIPVTTPIGKEKRDHVWGKYGESFSGKARSRSFSPLLNAPRRRFETKRDRVEGL